MNPEQLEQIVKNATEKAIDDKLGQFYIDREQHYQDHIFIKSFREWTGNIKSTALKTIVRSIVMFVLGLILLGFIFWGQHHNFTR